MYKFTLFNKARTWPRMVLLVLLTTTCTSAETTPERWGIAIQHDGYRGSDPLHLELAIVEGDPLVGTFRADTLPPGESAKKFSPIVIEGHERGDGTFWPNVELQVKTELDGKWLKIVSSLDDAVSAKVTVYSGMTLYGFFVNLEPFRDHIGKSQFGRVLLKSGQAATVKLDDLIDRSKNRSQTKKSD